MPKRICKPKNNIPMKKNLLYLFLFILGTGLQAQDCSDLFISEYVEGSGNNKALELYNPTNNAIDLSTYKLVRYSNGETVPYDAQLSGTIAPKSTFVVVLDKRDPNGTGQEVPVDLELQAKADLFLSPVYNVNRTMYFNGNDAMTLETVSGDIVDIFGQVGPPMLEDDNGWGNLNDTTITYNSGGVPTSYTIQNYIVGPLFWLAWSRDHTLIRKPTVKQGVKENPQPAFMVHVQWDSIPENTFDSLGFHTCECNTLSIGEPETGKAVIYPNPAIDNKFSITSAEAVARIELLDLTGRLVESVSFDQRANAYTFESAQQLKGMYLVKIIYRSNSVSTQKLLFD